MKFTDVIRRPLITEKTSILREDGRTIVFQVAKDANKIEIKRAVEQLLGAKVEHPDQHRARQDQAAGAIRRPPLGLEEGVREASRRRENAGIPGRRLIMGIRKFNPTSPGTRFQTVQTFDEITTQEPYKPLVEPMASTGGRNNQGTSRPGGAAAATSGCTASSTSSGTSATSRRRSRRSSTTRTARRGSRC